jgi:hypothetical protein
LSAAVLFSKATSPSCGMFRYFEAAVSHSDGCALAGGQQHSATTARP